MNSLKLSLSLSLSLSASLLTNIIDRKLSDGEFLRACRTVALKYPSLQFDEIIIDNCSMQLAMRPQQFDVMVTPNLYGAIITNIASALVGGPGLLAGANVGKRGAIFESVRLPACRSMLCFASAAVVGADV
jgi:isocitrate/isopropylmalate dehydrogenase